MHHPDIALIGKARSGKDTAASHLAAQFGYTRFAFADPLKEHAVKLNPWVDLSLAGEDEPRFIRLADLVDAWGWERAKDDVPEVRRILQNLGQGVRDMTPDYWVDRLVARVTGTDTPVVVTDCRYRNEAAALEAAGFLLIRVTRPGEGAGENSHHASETELDHLPTFGGLSNTGDIPFLHENVNAMMRYLSTNAA